jgi:8-oxo-dGTP diphosphatase
MIDVPNCFYRVSVKALVLNDTRDKFLLCEEEDGTWEFPGGGLDWGTTPQEDLPREIQEEMGLSVTKVAEHPCYFITDKTVDNRFWLVNILYETELEHLNFTPSEECINVKFVNKEDIATMSVFPSVEQLAEQFDPARHQ